MDFEPKQRAIAFCSRGELGLVLSATPVRVVYKQCNYCLGAISGADDDAGCTCETGMAWTGIHLSAEKFGRPWSSRTPRVVGEFRDVVVTSSGEELNAFVVEGRNQSRAHLHL